LVLIAASGRELNPIMIKTLPKNPRWREVLRTAYFVLQHCGINTQEARDLKSITKKTESILRMVQD